MAGSYPDVPGTRLAYDVDGTQMHLIDGSNNVTQQSQAIMQGLNNDDNSAPIGLGAPWYAFMFPEPVDLTGYFLSATTEIGYQSYNALYSTDTTNLLDGTWASPGGGGASWDQPVSPAYRTAIQLVNLLNVRAIKYYLTCPGNGTLKAVHFYGTYNPVGNQDKLLIWHPTLDQQIAGPYFDWGNTPRSSNNTKQFRVKNVSSTLTANSTTVNIESYGVGQPWHELSDDGVTYSTSVSIGALAPGAISPVLYSRYNLPGNAPLGPATAKMSATALSWA